MDSTLCSSASTNIFPSFKMSKALSEEEHVLSGYIKLLDEDDFFLCLSFGFRLFDGVRYDVRFDRSGLRIKFMRLIIR